MGRARVATLRHGRARRKRSTGVLKFLELISSRGKDEAEA